MTKDEIRKDLVEGKTAYEEILKQMTDEELVKFINDVSHAQLVLSSVRLDAKMIIIPVQIALLDTLGLEKTVEIFHRFHKES